MKKCRHIITIAIVLFSFVAVTNVWAKGPPEHANNDNNRHNTKVLTKYGRLMGILDANNTWVWKGVPYAKPPVGDLRWKAPEEPKSWKGVRQAKDECEPCTQLYTTSQWIRQEYALECARR